MLMSARNPALTATLLCAFSLVTVHCADEDYIGYNCTKTPWNQERLKYRNDRHKYGVSIRKTITDAKNFISDAKHEEFQNDWDKNTYKLEEIRRKREAREATQEEQPAHRYNSIRRKRKKPRSRNSVGNGLAEKQKKGGKKRGLPKAAGRTSAYGSSTLNFVKDTRNLAQETQEEFNGLLWERYMRTTNESRARQETLMKEQRAINEKRRRSENRSMKKRTGRGDKNGGKKRGPPKAARPKKHRGGIQSDKYEIPSAVKEAMKKLQKMKGNLDRQDESSVHIVKKRG